MAGARRYGAFVHANCTGDCPGAEDGRGNEQLVCISVGDVVMLEEGLGVLEAINGVGWGVYV